MNARPPRQGPSKTLTVLVAALLYGAGAWQLACAHGQHESGNTGTGDREAGTRPLDPLTSAEKEAAQQAALADRRVHEILAEEPRRVISVDFVAGKAESGGVVRSAEVLLYGPDREVGVRVLVRLEPAAVIAVERIAGPQVPLTAEDYELARGLALRSPEIQARFGPGLQAATIELLREVPSDDGDPCFRHRCVFLLFRLPEGYVAGPRVVVDLTEREVRVRGERE